MARCLAAGVVLWKKPSPLLEKIRAGDALGGLVPPVATLGLTRDDRIAEVLSFVTHA